MRQVQTSLSVQTPGRSCIELTTALEAEVRATGLQTGLCVVHCQHTSCSLVIQENADPSARADLLAWLERLAPDGDPHYTHTAEGPDDCPAHLRSAITQSSLSIPITAGRLALGTWQGVFLLEHRQRPHSRQLVVHIIGT